MRYCLVYIVNMCRTDVPFKSVLVALCLWQICSAGPPRVEDKPNLLDSYIPASMQIIAHLTDLMKYELRPGGLQTTTTSPRPTPSHRPAVFAPEHPPGPEGYFARKAAFLEQIRNMMKKNDQDGEQGKYGEQGKQEEQGRSNAWLPSEAEMSSLGEIFGQLESDHSGIYKNEEELEEHLKSLRQDRAYDKFDLYFGSTYEATLREANRIDNMKISDDGERTEEFLKMYDDSIYSRYLLRQKRIPPTRAYVSLLSLYDLLNKDSKKMGLNKYGGYSDEVLDKLVDNSEGSSAEQMRFVFSNVVQRKDTNDPDIIKKMKGFLDDLDKEDSYLNDALKYIPPLTFAS